MRARVVRDQAMFDRPEAPRIFSGRARSQDHLGLTAIEMLRGHTATSFIAIDGSRAVTG